MYWTIWLSLTFYAAAEIGKARRSRWAWWASAAGVVLLAIHIGIALDAVNWSHAATVASTARATREAFGIDAGAGVLANYVFLAVWAAETIWWRADAPGYASRSAPVRWSLRGLAMVMIVNAAIVFVPNWRRAIGMAIVATLVWAWKRRSEAGSSLAI